MSETTFESDPVLAKLLRDIPRVPQRQDSLHEQLMDLIKVANRLGMYDAADFIVAVHTRGFVR